MVTILRQPFDMLAETVIAARSESTTGTASSRISEKWRPFLDTYRTMCQAPADDFRRILEQVRDLTVSA